MFVGTQASMQKLGQPPNWPDCVRGLRSGRAAGQRVASQFATIARARPRRHIVAGLSSLVFRVVIVYFCCCYCLVTQGFSKKDSQVLARAKQLRSRGRGAGSSSAGRNRKRTKWCVWCALHFTARNWNWAFLRPNPEPSWRRRRRRRSSGCARANWLASHSVSSPASQLAAS